MSICGESSSAGRLGADRGQVPSVWCSRTLGYSRVPCAHAQSPKRCVRQREAACLVSSGYCTSEEKFSTLTQWSGQCEVVSAGVGVEKFSDDG